MPTDRVTTEFRAIDKNTQATLEAIGRSYDKLGASAQSYMKKMDFLEKEFNQLNNAQQKTAGGLHKFQNTMNAGGADAERLRARLAEVNDKIKKQPGLFERANAKIFRYRMLYISLAIAITLVKRALEATWEALNTGAKINEQAMSMERLAASYNTARSTIIKNLTEISKRTLSTADITKSANKAMIMGIAPGTINTLMEIAKAASRAMSETTEKMFADITLGTARSSKKILDNLGIIVDWKSAYQAHAAAIGVTVKMLTAEEKMVARTNAIKVAGSKIVRTLNTDYTTQKEKLDQLTASFENMFDSIKQGFADFIVPPEGIELTRKKVAELKTALEDLSKKRGAISFLPAIKGQSLEILLRAELALLEPILEAEVGRIQHQERMSLLSKKLQRTLSELQAIQTAATDKTKVQKLREAYTALSNTFSKLVKKIREEGSTAPDAMVEAWLKAKNKIKEILLATAADISTLEDAERKKRLAKEEREAKKIEALWKKSLNTLGLTHKTFIEKQLKDTLDAFKFVGAGGQLTAEDNEKLIEATISKLRQQLTDIDFTTALGLTPEKTAEIGRELADIESEMNNLAGTTDVVTKEIAADSNEWVIELKGRAADTQAITKKLYERLTVLIDTEFNKTTASLKLESLERVDITYDMHNKMEESEALYSNFYITEEAKITLKIEGEFDARAKAMNTFYEAQKNQIRETNALLLINAQTRLPLPGLGVTPVLDSFAHGIEFIPQTGPYLLHKGERVTPAEQNTSNNDNRQVTFNIYQQPGESTQDLSDELTRALELPGDYY